MKLPALDDLIPEQMAVYLRPQEQHLFVAGPPGSGKTTLAVLRAKLLAEKGKSVVLVTRNRMLAALAELLSDRKFETTTMHKFISSQHYQRVGSYAPESEKYVYDWDQVLVNYAAAAVEPSIDHLVIDEGQNLPPQVFFMGVQIRSTNAECLCGRGSEHRPMPFDI